MPRNFLKFISEFQIFFDELTLQFHRINESREFFCDHSPLNLVRSFILSISRNVLEFISQFQIFFEKHDIFRF